MDDDTEPCVGEKHIAALTAGERIPWAQTRKRYFTSGINAVSLNAIEKVRFYGQILIGYFLKKTHFNLSKAAFVLILDEEEYHISPVNIFSLSIHLKKTK